MNITINTYEICVNFFYLDLILLVLRKLDISLFFKYSKQFFLNNSFVKKKFLKKHIFLI